MPRLCQQSAILSSSVRTTLTPLYECPVCGYDKLVDPPANYNICPSCGTEFGNHDQNASILELRSAWESGGYEWWSHYQPKPNGWNGRNQLQKMLLRNASTYYQNQVYSAMLGANSTILAASWSSGQQWHRRKRKYVIPSAANENAVCA